MVPFSSSAINYGFVFPSEGPKGANRNISQRIHGTQEIFSSNFYSLEGIMTTKSHVHNHNYWQLSILFGDIFVKIQAVLKYENFPKISTSNDPQANISNFVISKELVFIGQYFLPDFHKKSQKFSDVFKIYENQLVYAIIS